MYAHSFQRNTYGNQMNNGMQYEPNTYGNQENNVQPDHYCRFVRNRQPDRGNVRNHAPFFLNKIQESNLQNNRNPTQLFEEEEEIQLSSTKGIKMKPKKNFTIVKTKDTNNLDNSPFKKNEDQSGNYINRVFNERPHTISLEQSNIYESPKNEYKGGTSGKVDNKAEFFRNQRLREEKDMEFGFQEDEPQKPTISVQDYEEPVQYWNRKKEPYQNRRYKREYEGDSQSSYNRYDPEEQNTEHQRGFSRRNNGGRQTEQQNGNKFEFNSRTPESSRGPPGFHFGRKIRDTERY